MKIYYIYTKILIVLKKSVTFTYNTRSKHELTVPTTRLHKINYSFLGNCVRFYNKIPIDIQNLSLNKESCPLLHTKKKDF